MEENKEISEEISEEIKEEEKNNEEIKEEKEGTDDNLAKLYLAFDILKETGLWPAFENDEKRNFANFVDYITSRYGNIEIKTDSRPIPISLINLKGIAYLYDEWVHDGTWKIRSENNRIDRIIFINKLLETFLKITPKIAGKKFNIGQLPSLLKELKENFKDKDILNED